MQKPDLNDVRIVGPGLNVFDWEVWEDVEYTVSLVGDQTLVSWSTGTFTDRPWRWWDPGHGKNDRKLYGTVWVLYLARKAGAIAAEWYADPADYVSHVHHINRIAFDTDEKFLRIRGGEQEGGGIPAVGSPVGYFVSGEARSTKHRGWNEWTTPPVWFRWTGDEGPIELAVFDDPTIPPPEPPPTPGDRFTVAEVAEMARRIQVVPR